MTDRKTASTEALDELRAALRAATDNVEKSKGTTEKQVAANRANAQSSTGPKTEGGRCRSSRNALKHGLTAKKILLDTEREEDFTEYYAKLFLALKPEGAIEHALAERIALNRWRQRRVYGYETGMTREALRNLQSESPTIELSDGAQYFDLFSCQKRNGLVHLGRYEGALARYIREDTAELERLQDRRKKAARQAPTNNDSSQSGTSVNPAAELRPLEKSRATKEAGISPGLPTARVRHRPKPL